MTKLPIDISARPCGCDPGIDHRCERHAAADQLPTAPETATGLESPSHFEHGRTCPKKVHETRHEEHERYMHDADDDGPYFDDGLTYCGRCHCWISEAEARAASRFIPPAPHAADASVASPAAAPATVGADVLDALEDLIAIIDAAGLSNLSRGVQLGQTAWYVKASERMDYARYVIAQAKGCAL